MTPPSAPFSAEDDLFLTGGGLIRVWPENRPVVRLWPLLGDQWIRAGMDGRPVAPDMAVMLAYAQAWCAEHGGPVLPLVERLRIMANTMLGFLHADLGPG